MTNKFVFGVANAWGYDDSGNILFQSKTLLDSSVNTTISSVDVRGGYSNPLLAQYFHSPNVEITLTDTQWNLNFLAKIVGSSLTTGKNVYAEESVTLGADGAGTITGTPVAYVGSTIYGWVTLTSGVDETVEFSSKNFDCSGAEGDVVTVRYYTLDAAAKSVTITSNFVPSTVRLVLEAQLFSSDSSSSKIGTVLFEFPKAILSGAIQIQLKADGVSSTPMTARALAYTPAGATQSIFGYVSEKLTSGNWYDNVTAMAIVGGDFSLASTTGTKQLTLKCFHSDGSTSTPPSSGITWASSDQTKATVGTGATNPGLVTGLVQGTTTIKASITSKNTIDANVVCTVPGA